MDNAEKIIYSNAFGTVTDRRVVLNYRSGTEDIPVEKISSISFHHNRNYFLAIGSLVAIVILLLPLFVNDHIPGSIITISSLGVLFFLLSGIANWIGHHNILVGVAGKNRKPLKVEMGKTREGRQFVDAVKKSILAHFTG
jgi:hypothetical protein